MEQEAVYVGIDVAKAHLDVAVRPIDQRWTISNDEPGIRDLVSRLRALEPAMVVLEASGGLELPSVAALAAASLPVAIVNPRQVRDFAKATGTLAKTDALDAAVLAHFADAVRPAVRPLRDAETQVLNSLVARRHQVIAILVAEKNRLGSAISAVRPRIEAHIAWLEQELNDIDEGLRADSPSESRVAREGRPPAHRPRRGRAALHHPSGPFAGAWRPGPAPGRRLGGSGSLQQGQRRHAWQTHRLGRDAPASAPSCTWERWPPAASTPSSGTSTSGCWPLVSPRRWPSSPVCANCSSYSTPCSSSALPGALSAPAHRHSSVTHLDFQHS